MSQNIGAGAIVKILDGVRYLANSDVFEIEANTRVSRPFSLGVRLNRHCNLACSYCLSTSGPKSPNTVHLPILRDETFLSWLPSRIVFCGGEPTLVPQLPEFVSRFGKLGCLTTVTSNGIRLPDHSVLNGSTWYDVSIHGVSPERYEETTGFDGFDLVMSNVKILASLKDVRLSCSFVVVTPHSGPYLDLCRKLCDWGVRKIRFARMLPLGRGRYAVKRAPTQEELADFTNAIREADLPVALILPATKKFEALQDGYFVLEDNGRFSSPEALKGMSPAGAVANSEWARALEQHVTLFSGTDG